MKVRDRIIQAAHALSEKKAVGEISLAEIARESGVSWPTVRRHVGGRDGLPGFLHRAGVVPVEPSAKGSAKDQPIDTRSRILRAAFQIFAERGYSGATLDDVAAVAGMTKGAVYWHFAGKDDLCMALIEDRFQREGSRYADAVQSAVREGGGAGEPVVVAFMASEVVQAHNAEGWRQLGLEFMSRSRDPSIRRRYAELSDKIYRETIPVVGALIESGVVAENLDPKAVAALWRCLLLGMGLWMTQDPEGVDFEAMAPSLARLLWRGMAPDTPARPSPANDSSP